MRRLVEHERVRQHAKALERLAPRAWSCRKKTREQKRPFGDARCRKGGDRGVRPRNRDHPESGGARFFDDRRPRIGDRGRTGVRDQCNGLASGELLDDPVGGPLFIVPVHRYQLSLHAMALEQARRHARILRRDGVGMSE